MIILDDGFVSDRMRAYLAETQQCVLCTPMARTLASSGVSLNIVQPVEAVARIDEGERLYAMSEGRFSWVTSHVHRPEIVGPLSIFKNKALTRRTLKPLFPDYEYQTWTIDELQASPYPRDLAPFVLKPIVGFLSAGVHRVACEEDWKAALEDIAENRAQWSEWYDDSVIGSSAFIIESCIEGDEYAIDAYYDGEGKAHVLDILRHDFSDPHDTSDRLYYTGPSIMRENLEPMTAFLDAANELIGARDFPVHVEVRRSGEAIVPIEVNPLRFAGLGGTEISSFAYGFYTFDCFLNDRDPDWDAIFAKLDDDDLFCMSVLAPAPGVDPALPFDYDRFCARFPGFLAIDRFDAASSGIYGFQFWRTSAKDPSEREFMLGADLREFLA